MTGGTSYIDGLIQVLRGRSNIFLMNPAGAIFGPNARFHIPASLQGQQFKIEGETRSRANFFQSLDKFNINFGQTANTEM